MNLVIGETYQFRLRLVFAGRNIEDTIRPSFTADNSTFIESYTEVNDLTEDLLLTTGALMIAQIFAIQGTGEIGLLVENGANPSRITENETIDNTPATNVSLSIEGVETTVQSFSMATNKRLFALEKSYSTAFILVLRRDSINTDIVNGTSRNLLQDVTLNDATVIIGRPITDFSMVLNMLRLPKSRNNPIVTYDIVVRISGTTTLGAKNYLISLKRPSGVVMSTIELSKTIAGALDNRIVTFFPFTSSNTDSFIVDGLQVVFGNSSGADFRLTSLEIQIRGSDE